MIKKLAREPLVHFILLGLLTYAGWLWWGGDREGTITVTAEQQERLATLWEGEAGRAPTAAELSSAVAMQVEEEALYREALRLGLDADDTIVRRRLAQKMRFLLEDLEEIDDPGDATLEAWFEERADRFATDGSVSFSHVFVRPDEGEGGETRAAELLSQLQYGAEWRGLGDPFILQRSYGEISQAKLAELFGASFAKAVFEQSTKREWVGPLASTYGLHLLRIENRKAGQAVQFEDVRGAVLSAWREEQALERNRASVEELVDSYDVVIEPR